MTSTQRPISVRSAIATIRQGVEDLEQAMPAVAPGKVSLLSYWLRHLKDDAKTLELLSMTCDDDATV